MSSLMKVFANISTSQNSILSFTMSIQSSSLAVSMVSTPSTQKDSISITQKRDIVPVTNTTTLFKKMTRWLQRQEALDLHAAYLRWLNILIEPEDDLCFPDLEEPQDFDDGEADYHQEARNTNAILTELKAEAAPSFTYKIAKVTLSEYIPGAYNLRIWRNRIPTGAANIPRQICAWVSQAKPIRPLQHL